MTVYGTSSIKRTRRTKSELKAIDSHMEPWRLNQFQLVGQEERKALRSMFRSGA